MGRRSVPPNSWPLTSGLHLGAGAGLGTCTFTRRRAGGAARSIENSMRIRGDALSDDEKCCPGGCGKRIHRDRRHCGRRWCDAVRSSWAAAFRSGDPLSPGGRPDLGATREHSERGGRVVRRAGGRSREGLSDIRVRSGLMSPASDSADPSPSARSLPWGLVAGVSSSACTARERHLLSVSGATERTVDGMATVRGTLR